MIKCAGPLVRPFERISSWPRQNGYLMSQGSDHLSLSNMPMPFEFIVYARAGFLAIRKIPDTINSSLGKSLNAALNFGRN